MRKPRTARKNNIEGSPQYGEPLNADRPTWSFSVRVERLDHFMKEDVMLSEITVKMTKAQAEWAEWAIDPMEDYWDEQAGPAGNDDGEKPEELPRVEGRKLIIPADPMQDDVIEDFLYRLEDQAQDISYADCQYQAARSARKLAERIRAAKESA